MFECDSAIPEELPSVFCEQRWSPPPTQTVCSSDESQKEEIHSHLMVKLAFYSPRVESQTTNELHFESSLKSFTAIQPELVGTSSNRTTKPRYNRLVGSYPNRDTDPLDTKRVATEISATIIQDLSSILLEHGTPVCFHGQIHQKLITGIQKILLDLLQNTHSIPIVGKHGYEDDEDDSLYCCFP